MAAGVKGPRQFQDLFDVIPFTGSITLTAVAGAETQATISVPGAEVGDIVLWGIEEDLEASATSANVNVVDVVEFCLVNATGSTITIVAAVVNGIVLQPKGNFEK